MSYPNLPNNRLVVNGVDLTTEYNMILADGYALKPPEPKTFIVDIPGGNGKLDLSESLMGDTAYGNRKQEFTFYVVDVNNFETVKTNVVNFLHGQLFNYTMTMDPTYTYHGRFKVTDCGHTMYQNGKVGLIKIEIESDPYKHKAQQVLTYDCTGGRILTIPSGRERINPIIENLGVDVEPGNPLEHETKNNTIKVIYDRKEVSLQKGSWKINDLYFTKGSNEIYVNTLSTHNLTWGYLCSKEDIGPLSEFGGDESQVGQYMGAGFEWTVINDRVYIYSTNSKTWAQFKTKRLFEWYKQVYSMGPGLMNIPHYDINDTWSDAITQRWSQMSETTWSDHVMSLDDSEFNAEVKIKYDWGDL